MDITIFPFFMFRDDIGEISVNQHSRGNKSERASLTDMRAWADERGISHRADFVFYSFYDLSPQMMLEFRLTFEGSTDFH